MFFRYSIVGLATSLPRPYAPAPTSIPNYNGDIQEITRKAALEHQFIYDELSQVIDELNSICLCFLIEKLLDVIFH